MKRRRNISVLFYLLVFAAAPAQTTFASITGTITDSTGAAVAGATVTAVQTESNYRYTAQSNAAGAYTLAQLREGVYTVRVQFSGFKEFVASDVRLVSLDVRRIDVQLEVGAVDTRVEVTAGATLIETETARISDSKSAMPLAVLPLNTRSLWNFVGLSPGVVQAGNDSSTRRFAGSRANQSDASIDGITLSNQYDGTQISPLVSQIEAFEEVRVDMANNTAEFGGIGQVTIISKGGFQHPPRLRLRLLLHTLVPRPQSVRGATRHRRAPQSRSLGRWAYLPAQALRRPQSQLLLLLL